MSLFIKMFSCWLIQFLCVDISNMLDILVLRSFLVSPIYLCLHVSLLHSIMYIMFVCDVQLIFRFMVHLNVFPLMNFPSFIYGQIMHLLHLFMPFNFCFSWVPIFGGNLALIRKSLIFLCLLNATKGGSGNTVARHFWGSFLTATFGVHFWPPFLGSFLDRHF